MRGEAFWGLKNPENPGASGGSAPWTPTGGVAPGPHQGPLSGPLDLTPSRRSARYAAIFLQHPAVTNPAHAHGFYLAYDYYKPYTLLPKKNLHLVS